MISKAMMPIAWHPKRWWNSCISEDEKKKKRNRTDLLSNAFNVYNLRVLANFEI